MSKILKKLTLSDICDRFSEVKNTVILFHMRPDGDAVGSALSAKLLLEAAGSRAWCVCANEIPQRLSFLSEGIQKSSLVENLPADFSIERIITVDTASSAQLGEMWERFGDEIEFMIDHHAKGEPYADYYVASDAAATGEMIFDLSREMLARGIIKVIPEKTDYCLYAAISSDTGSFRYSNATPKTHRCAAELIEHGIDASDINRRLFEIKTASSLRAMSLAIENMNVYCNGRISIVALDKDQIDRANILPEDCDMFIEAARSVEGSEIAIAIRKTSENEDFRVSMRTSGNADVSSVCRHFGGGGHVKAAGCSVAAKNINEALLLVLKEAERQLV